MILLTGHKGFIGSCLLDTLQKMKTNKLIRDDVMGYDLLEGDDIRDEFKLYRLFKDNNINTVIHCAALAGVRSGEDFPEQYISTNVWGTKNLLKMSEQYGVEKFIFFSSSSVYGENTPPNKESDETNPTSTYAISKLAGELLVKNSNVPSIIIRPFTVYGENGRPDQVIYKWINQIKAGKPITFFGDGTTKRGYTYVGDLVYGIVKLLISNDVWREHTGETFNLGGNQIVTLQELVDIFSKTISNFKINKLPLPQADVHDNWADITKAKEYLSFKPQTDFKKKVISIIESELYGHNN